jgi:DNA repair protein RadC
MDPKIIFGLALGCQATGIMLSHNHPSGQTKPSDADIRLTRKVKECGILLEIQLLDHVIIAPRTDQPGNPAPTYFSFADEGIM